ncbi:hypothetical protein E3N88_28393 [Mikania micrantha]|uniref:Uncharacterized protein n=1 Tax=Mikania micrantha TaxID=192012 RepID=A0A5N6N2C4_9ASTR|nr:hypothetical protein E3N88_28393 [Mikania micrantha]
MGHSLETMRLRTERRVVCLTTGQNVSSWQCLGFGIFLDNKSSFVSFHCSISIIFMFKKPHATNDRCISSLQNKDPRLICQKSIIFISHGISPVRVGESDKMQFREQRDRCRGFGTERAVGGLYNTGFRPSLHGVCGCAMMKDCGSVGVEVIKCDVVTKRDKRVRLVVIDGLEELGVGNELGLGVGVVVNIKS